LWEEQFGLNPKSSADAGIDTDKDGYSNYEEFQLNSSPLNSSDPPSDVVVGGEEEDDKSDAIGSEWILVLVVVIIILIVLIIIVFILMKKTRDREGGKPGITEPKDKKVEEPQSTVPTTPADPGTGPGPSPPPPPPPVQPPPPQTPAQPKAPNLANSLPPLQSQDPKSIESKES
jgi:type IV secretory pathway VirB10-like protein